MLWRGSYEPNEAGGTVSTSGRRPLLAILPTGAKREPVRITYNGGRRPSRLTRAVFALGDQAPRTDETREDGRLRPALKAGQLAPIVGAPITALTRERDVWLR